MKAVNKEFSYFPLAMLIYLQATPPTTKATACVGQAAAQEPPTPMQ